MLTSDLMAEVKRLQIATRSIISEVFAGEYESAFKGRGLEFAEVRAYQPGDDVRMIDWNVTARTGEPFVKLCVEERELTVMLAVDLSASGQFGSTPRMKNRIAAELSAVLGFVAAKGEDKVGLAVFTDHVERFIPAKKGSRHVLRVVREVLSHEPTGRGTSIPALVDHLGRVLRRRSIIFLVSDFLAHGFEDSVKLLARKHDVVALAVRDPRERELPDCGLIEVQDAETGQRRLVDTGSRRVRRRYGALMAEDEARLESTFRRIGVDFALIRAGEPYGQTLVDLFRRREGWR
jgi:uncharacterized protein (DUF58 family)